MFISGISFFSGLILIFFSIILFWKSQQYKSKSLARYHFVLVGLLGFFDCLFLLRAVEGKILSFCFRFISRQFYSLLCISPAVYFHVQLLFEGNGFRWKKQFCYHAIACSCLPSFFILFPFRFPSLLCF